MEQQAMRLAALWKSARDKYASFFRVLGGGSGRRQGGDFPYFGPRPK